MRAQRNDVLDTIDIVIPYANGTIQYRHLYGDEARTLYNDLHELLGIEDPR